jgi:phage tail protein X
MVEKETMAEMEPLRPREAEELRSDRSFYTKIAIGAAVVSLFAVLAVVYWPESRRVSPREGEGILSPVQEQEGKGVQKGISKKEEWEGISVKAETGWTLFFLAKRHYGAANSTLVDLILEANPQITDLAQIQLNQVIKIPRIKEDLLLSQTSSQSYTIHLGTFADQSQVRIFENEPLLAGKNLETLSRKVSSQKTWYRILAGEYKNKEEAIKTIQALRQKGLLPAFSGRAYTQ